jgi:uncharacterized protein YkwD
VVVVVGVASAGAAPPSTTCTGQSVVITPANEDRAERSLLCLINVYRGDNGRSPLTSDGSLSLAAARHSYDMVDRGYFDHNAPAPAPYGKTPAQRAQAAGYPANTISTGENLAAESPEGTPFTLFEQWRTSTSGHDALMLHPSWVTAGLGIVRGWPGDPGSPTFGEGATLTGVFGAQNRGGTDTAAELAGGDPNAVPGPPPDGPGGDGVRPAKEGERVVLTPTRGSIRIKPPGSASFRKLGESDDVPIGTTIDAITGAVQVSSDYNGTAELAEFASGRFKAQQSAGGNPVFGAKLVGSFAGSGGATAGTVKAARKRRGGKRRLWASSDGGHFRTRGRRASATVRGTRWLTVDIRDRTGRIRTSFRVTEGVLEIDDFTIAGTVNARVEAGETYVAKKKKRRRR